MQGHECCWYGTLVKSSSSKVQGNERYDMIWYVTEVSSRQQTVKIVYKPAAIINYEVHLWGRNLGSGILAMKILDLWEYGTLKWAIIK